MDRYNTAAFFKMMLDGIERGDFSESAFDTLYQFIVEYGSKGAPYAARILRTDIVVIDDVVWFNHPSVLNRLELSQNIHKAIGVK